MHIDDEIDISSAGLTALSLMMRGEGLALQNERMEEFSRAKFGLHCTVG